MAVGARLIRLWTGTGCPDAFTAGAAAGVEDWPAGSMKPIAAPNMMTKINDLDMGRW